MKLRFSKPQLLVKVVFHFFVLIMSGVFFSVGCLQSAERLLVGCMNHSSRCLMRPYTVQRYYTVKSSKGELPSLLAEERRNRIVFFPSKPLLFYQTDSGLATVSSTGLNEKYVIDEDDLYKKHLSEVLFQKASKCLTYKNTQTDFKRIWNLLIESSTLGNNRASLLLAWKSINNDFVFLPKVTDHWGELPQLIYEVGIASKNKQRVMSSVLERLQTLADEGIDDANMILAFIYCKRLGSISDHHDSPPKIIQWFENKARMGKSYASLALGVYYEWGFLVRKDLVRANMFYWQAVERGSANACYFLGRNHLQGRGVPLNNEKAIEILLKGAECGSEDSQMLLARLKVENKNTLIIPEAFLKRWGMIPRFLYSVGSGRKKLKQGTLFHLKVLAQSNEELSEIVTLLECSSTREKLVEEGVASLKVSEAHSKGLEENIQNTSVALKIYYEMRKDTGHTIRPSTKYEDVTQKPSENLVVSHSKNNSCMMPFYIANSSIQTIASRISVTPKQNRAEEIQKEHSADTQAKEWSAPGKPSHIK